MQEKNWHNPVTEEDFLTSVDDFLTVEIPGESLVPFVLVEDPEFWEMQKSLLPAIFWGYAYNFVQSYPECSNVELRDYLTSQERLALFSDLSSEKIGEISLKKVQEAYTEGIIKDINNACRVRNLLIDAGYINLGKNAERQRS